MAQATMTAQWRPPVPVSASPEMEALRPFHFDCEWTGKVQAGGMGPDSPEMEAVGKAIYQPIMDGGWLVGDFEQDQFVDGAFSQVALTRSPRLLIQPARVWLRSQVTPRNSCEPHARRLPLQYSAP